MAVDFNKRSNPALYGTGNPAKLASMKKRLEKLDIDLIGINDMRENGFEIPDVPDEV